MLKSSNLRVHAVVSAMFAACLCAPVLAEVEPPAVTGISNGHAAKQTIGDETLNVGLGSMLDSGLLSVEENQKLMLFCAADKGGQHSGGVVGIIGPAEIDVQWEENKLTLLVKSGRVMTSADCPQTDQLVFIKAATSDAQRRIDSAIGQGETYLHVSGEMIEFGFESASGNSLRTVINDVDRSVGSGKKLTLRADAVEESDAGAWRDENDLDLNSLVMELSIKSARTSRIMVQTRLIDSVIAWDKYAQAENIEPETEANKMEPEIRQVVAAVQTSVLNTTNRGGSPQTPNVQGANEVPSLSPAAVSVGGVTAVEVNNASAANLLTRTQSRGLGFNGPAQLSTPGFLGGRRTIGPPGLGAEKSIKR